MFKVAINSEADQKEQPSLKERALKAFSPEIGDNVLGLILGSAVNLENHYSDQRSRVGQMFADYALDDLKKKGLNYQYYQTPVRSNLSLGKGGKAALPPLLTSFLYPMPDTHTTGVKRDAAGKRRKLTREQISTMFATPRAKSINSELQGIVVPDAVEKAFVQKEPWVQRMINAVDSVYPRRTDGTFSPEAAAAAEAMIKADINYVKDIDGYVTAPRNNMRALAHEFGHAYDNLGELNPPKSEFLKKVKGAVGSVSRWFERPLIGNLPAKARVKVEQMLGKLPNPMVRSITQTGLGLNTPLPVSLVLGTKMLDVAKPEIMEKLEEKDPTGALKFINDNPALAGAIVQIPHFAKEVSTTIPGAKLTYNFWKDLNSGKLDNHVFAKEVTQVVGKKSPLLEAAKFVGKNLLTTGLPVYAPLLAMYAYNKYKDRDTQQ